MKRLDIQLAWQLMPLTVTDWDLNAAIEEHIRVGGDLNVGSYYFRIIRALMLAGF